ncbi:hypothetical protein T07_9447 [Trichinella nelsoni]|uniref:Uncharacterized protein n=1 Tax=Trichinella nelsoni TaxID=6336 RepID=A0A0V0RI48_9BILA|nr:hypothetical protein T07_9447 [Trichinella nelsoni]
MRPCHPGEDPPTDTSFRCLPVVQPGSDENTAGFPSVRRGDSVRTPTDRSERFLSAPPNRRTLFDTSGTWCLAGTPRGGAGTTFFPASLMPVLPQPIRCRVRSLCSAVFPGISIAELRWRSYSASWPWQASTAVPLSTGSMNCRSISVCQDSVSKERTPIASNSQNFQRAALRRSSVLMQRTLHSRSLDNAAGPQITHPSQISTANGSPSPPRITCLFRKRK